MEQDLNTLRFDQVGSLLRPQWLKDLYARHGDGAATDEELQAGQDRAIREVIAQQESLGLPVATDGEFRRLGFQDSFGTAVSGFANVARDVAPSPSPARDVAPSPPPAEGGGDGAPGRVPSGMGGPGPAISHRLPAQERLRLAHNVLMEEYRFSSAVASVPVKLTLVGPDRISQRFEWESSRQVYKDMDEFLTDVVVIERQMIAEVIAAGCRYVQIDAPGYTAYVDPPSLDQMRNRGEDPMANLERSIRADNAVIAGFPGVTFGIHVCRGNAGANWHREGHYDAIAERLFNGLRHQRLLLEYDTERAGTFDPLRFVPKGKVAVVGLVSTKTAEVETADYLKRRLDAAARFLPLDQLALSPQCGFASGLRGNPLSEEDQWNKFRVILEVIRDVWGT